MQTSNLEVEGINCNNKLYKFSHSNKFLICKNMFIIKSSYIRKILRNEYS